MTSSLNCVPVNLKCTNDIQTLGSLEDMMTCKISKLGAPKIHDENANVKIDQESPDTKYFDANKVEIWYFPNIIQSTFPNLLAIEMIGSKLKKISMENFEKLTNLTYLNISDNEIQQLDENLFQNNTQLTVINLRNNQIKKIHQTAFLGPQNIINLDLLNNVCVSQTFDNGAKTIIIEKISITCWNHYQLSENINNLQQQNSIIMSNLTSQIKNLMPEVKEIQNINKTLFLILEKLAKINISFNPFEATTIDKPGSYIAEKLNISLSSMIPIPFTSVDVSIVSSIMTFILLLLLCCICCRKAPKPVETFKTIVVKSSDYGKMTTLRKFETENSDDHTYEVLKKNISENENNLISESDENFDNIPEEEKSAVQTDWSVAYRTESEEKVQVD